MDHERVVVVNDGRLRNHERVQVLRGRRLGGLAGRERRQRAVVRGAGPGDHACERRQRNQAERNSGREPALPPGPEAGRRRLLLLRLREAPVELRDEAVGVEGEGIGVAAQERPGVGTARQRVKAIFLERPQVPLTQAGQAFGIGKDKALRLASRSQARTDIEHGTPTLSANSESQGSATSTLPSCRATRSTRSSIGSPSR